MRILVINPGGGSTKIGVWENQNKIFEQTIKHSPKELARFPVLLDQYPFRRDLIINILTTNNFN